jgi:CRP-like cAMP-binding protein
MSLSIGTIESPSQREQIYRFRYRVYVEELAMTSDADHERKWLRDDLDEQSVSYAVMDDGEVKGSLRVTYLEDLPDPSSIVEKFDMEPAVEAFGTSAICTTSRFILDQELRHGTIIYRLMLTAFLDARERNARLNFGDCSPHLLPFYEHLGYRRYTPGFNDTAYGFKLPILMLFGDREYFERVRSPLRRPAKQGSDDTEARAWFRRSYPDYESSETASFLPDNVFFDLLTERVASDPLHRVALLHGLEREEAERFLSEATLIDLRPGDRVIRKGDRDNTLFVLLSGLADAESGLPGRPPLFTFGAGDTFGEIGFLTAVPRTADVKARTDCRVLVLSGDFMERFVAREPAIGAKILLNLSRELAGRLAMATDLTSSSPAHSDAGAETER